MQAATLVSLEDYLATEAESDFRREYWDGEIIAMSGSSLQHNRVVVRLLTHLTSHLNGCETFGMDVRVRVSPSRYAYPDVVVVCGKPELTDENPPSLLNPTVIVEVLSDSTRRYDISAKLEGYLKIDTLKEYWTIEQDGSRAIQYVRSGEEWVLRICGGQGSVLRSEALDLSLPLDSIYPAQT